MRVRLWIPVVVALGILLMAAEHECEVDDEPKDETAIEDLEATPLVEETLVVRVCKPVSDDLVDLLEESLLDESASIAQASLVESNNGMPWRFIGGEVVYGEETEGTNVVWGSWSSVLDANAELFAADNAAVAYSSYGFPGRAMQVYADEYKDEIEVARLCVE